MVTLVFLRLEDLCLRLNLHPCFPLPKDDQLIQYWENGTFSITRTFPKAAQTMVVLSVHPLYNSKSLNKVNGCVVTQKMIKVSYVYRQEQQHG
jgi:hypothetical protein